MFEGIRNTHAALKCWVAWQAQLPALCMKQQPYMYACLFCGQEQGEPGHPPCRGTQLLPASLQEYYVNISHAA